MAENVVSLCGTLREKRLLFAWISFLLWDHSNKLFSVWVEKSICPSFQLILIPPSPVLLGKQQIGPGEEQEAEGKENTDFYPILQLFPYPCACVWMVGLEGIP